MHLPSRRGRLPRSKDGNDFTQGRNPGIKSSTLTLGGKNPNTEVGERAHSLLDRATDSAHGTVDRLVAKAEPALDRVGDVADDLRTAAYIKWDDFINSEDKVESARSEIRGHPLTVVAIALVAAT